MKNILILLFYSLTQVSFLSAQYAPDSVTGTKLHFDFTLEGENISIDFYNINDFASFGEYGHIGEWGGSWYTWEKTSPNTGTLKIAEHGPFTTGFTEVFMTFTSQTAGTGILKEYEYEDGKFDQSPVMGWEATGSFTLFEMTDSDALPFDVYFKDDFSSDNINRDIWPQEQEYGIELVQSDGVLSLQGTLTDADERWYEINANTILKMSEDWVVEGEAFSNLHETEATNYGALLGIDLETTKIALIVDLSIGITPWGIYSEIRLYDQEAGDHPSLGREEYQFQSITLQEGNSGKFRIRNDSDNKIIYTEYMNEGIWTSVFELNWHSGLLTRASSNLYSSSSDLQHQFTGWVALDDYNARPDIDFRTPVKEENGNIEILPLTAGNLGFRSYSVTKGKPVAKNWMWFDHYPWVYSAEEGNWIYFYPSNSKLMYFSVKNNAWMEME